ncbi:MAG: thioredoxin [Pseudomonadota bacterium]
MDLMGGTGAAAEAGGADIIKDASTATFAADVVDASRDHLVIVDFWAAWCGPCKQLTPVLEKVVQSYGGAVRLVKVDVDQNQALAGQLRVQSLPTVMAFRDGRPVDGFMGALPESEVRAFIDRCGVPADGAAELAQALQMAQDALAENNLQDAASIFAAVLQQDQLNTDALAGLASCYLKSGDRDRAAQTLELVPPDQQDHAAVQSVKAAIALEEQADAAGPVSELEAKVTADPDDHQARIDLALALAAGGRKADAIGHLIESFKRDREWNEAAARKQLLNFFEAWGPTDKMTVEGRKRLSSVMFA